MLDRPLDHLRKHRLAAADFPFKPIGGNVLLRRVKDDVRTFLVEGRDNRVLQVGEMIGLGNRWTEDAQWWPPVPVPRRTDAFTEIKDEYGNGTGRYREGWDPDWKPPDMSQKLPRPAARFGLGHERLLSDLKVGDLVVYTSARIYDVFAWENEDILLYPGNFIHAVIERSHLADHPEARRYDVEPK